VTEINKLKVKSKNEDNNGTVWCSKQKPGADD